MPKYPRLKQVGSYWWHRAAVPKDIRDSYGKTEEKFSLGTTDYWEARRLIKKASYEVDQKFEEHRRQQALANQAPLDEITDRQIKYVGEQYCVYLLEEDYDRRLEGFEDSYEGLPPTPMPTFDEYSEDMKAFGSDTGYDNARGIADDFIRYEAEMFLWDYLEIKLKPDSLSWPKLYRAIRQAIIRATENIEQRNQGKVVETPEVDDPPQAHKSGPLLSVVSKQWLQEKRESDIDEKTLKDYRAAFRLFISMADDQPIGDYTKADGRSYRKVLSKIPPKWEDKPEFKGLDIVSAANKAHELGMTPIVTKTRNKYIDPIKACWEWLEPLYDECQTCPVAGMRFPVQNRGKAGTKREPFSIQDLQTIFTAPIFTGCRSIQFWKTSGDIVPIDSSKYWVPLIALLTGARLNEILQLYVKDVGCAGDIWYFDINEDGEDKRLKTKPYSIRQLPIHQSLVDMGFLKHIEARKARNELRLFPDAKIDAEGRYSNTFSKFFNDRFLKAIKVKAPKKVFYSFRHNFKDACRQCDVRQEHTEALMGHAPSGMATVYGSGEFPIELLAREMAKVAYRGLDLSHLTKNWPIP